MSFGDRLKQYREAKGYTQEQLASLIGVAKTTITGYERGNRTPDVDKIKKLAAALGVTGDDLLDTGISPQKSPLVSSEALQLAQDYDNLDGHGQRIVRMVVDEEKARCKEVRKVELQRVMDLIQQGIDEEPEDSEPARTDADIEREVEDFRRRLLLEKKQAGTSSQSSGAGSETA